MNIMEIFLWDYPAFDNATYFIGRFDEIPFYDWEGYEFVRFDTSYRYNPRHFALEFTVTDVSTIRFFFGISSIFALIIDTDFFYALVHTIRYGFFSYLRYLYYLILEMYLIGTSSFSMALFDYVWALLLFLLNYVSGIVLFFIVFFILLFGLLDVIGDYFITFDDLILYHISDISLVEFMRF